MMILQNGYLKRLMKIWTLAMKNKLLMSRNILASVSKILKQARMRVKLKNMWNLQHVTGDHTENLMDILLASLTLL
jgi:hypothetical protein